ncbi:N/A [soil metagenome]
MTKLLLRYFIICVVFTILIFLLLLYVYTIVDNANTLENIKLITKGKFLSLDEYLESHPPQQWQILLDKLHPNNASFIKAVPLTQLTLTNEQKQDIKKNKIVDIFHQDDPKHPLIVYKRINNSNFVYQDYLEFNDTEKAHRYFGWVPNLIVNKLNALPVKLWPQTLKELSKQYGYPLSINELAKLNLSQQKKQHLAKNEWLVDLPNNNDSVQTIYVPILSDKILIIGPINLPFYGVYQKYILFICGFIAIEFIIFIWAVLFSRTLTKLSTLADNYGRGNFDNVLKVNKTSTLFSLFNNLQIMGTRIKKLIGSHKELTNAVSHELRTPISRLRFSLHALLECQDYKVIHAQAKTMEEDIVELENLVSEVLTYARLDRTDLVLKCHDVLLTDLIIFAIKKIQPIFPNKKLIKNFDILNNVIVFANEKYLLRAIENLLCNAYRFAVTTVKISLEANSKKLQLIIEDDGLGIPDQDKHRVFIPFVQLDNRVELEEGGFGLGLAIAKKIIEQHNWSISISDSNLGGAKIVVIIN